MILLVKTSLGREFELDSNNLPLQGRAGLGVQLKNRGIRLKKNETIILVEPKENV